MKPQRTSASPDPSPLDLGAPPRRRWGWLVLGMTVVSSLGAGAWYATRAPEPTAYVSAAVTHGNLTIEVTATGTLQPVNQVDVGTEVSGTIMRVMVDHNDRVEAGQVLAELDPDQSHAKVRQSEAALALARARVQEADATVTETASKLQRTRELIAKRMASPDELDTVSAAAERARAALAVANAQVSQAQAEVDANRWFLEKTIIRSPIEGVVLRRQVEPGQTVAASLQTPVLFTLAESLAQMELNIAVDEADVGQVRVGQEALFRVDAYPNREFPATITQVRFAPETINGVVTYAALLELDNSELLLRPGMTATAEILIERIEDALLVPNAALRFSPPRDDANSGASGGAGTGGGLLGVLLPRRPPSARRPTSAELPVRQEARVWVLEQGQPKPVVVKTGASDGVSTQVMEADLEPGSEVLVGIARARSRS